MFPVVPGCVKYRRGFKIFPVNVLYSTDNFIFFTNDG